MADQFGRHALNWLAVEADSAVTDRVQPGAELDAPALRGLRNLCETRLRLVSVNMPNVDMNIAAASGDASLYA